MTVDDAAFTGRFKSNQAGIYIANGAGSTGALIVKNGGTVSLLDDGSSAGNAGWLRIGNSGVGHVIVDGTGPNQASLTANYISVGTATQTDSTLSLTNGLISIGAGTTSFTTNRTITTTARFREAARSIAARTRPRAS